MGSLRAIEERQFTIAVELDKRGQEHGIRAFAAHPGRVLTDLLRYMTTDEELNTLGI